MKYKKFVKSIAQLCLSVCFSAVFLLLFLTPAFAAPGDLDTGFGSGGTVLTEFDQYIFGQIVLVQPDSKIIVAGSITYPGTPANTYFVVLRYNSNGSLDATFGNQGKVFTSILGSDVVKAGALQGDGKIVIGGESGDGFSVVRYNADGSLDSTFGSSGKITTSLPSTPVVQMHALLIQPDGKIVTVGDNQGTAIYLLRYNADGTADTSFGSGGKVISRIFPLGNYAATAALQTDGKILVGGAAYNDATGLDSAIFRYNTDGTLDNTFDNDGAAVYPVSNRTDSIRKLLIRPDGKILSVGRAAHNTQLLIYYTIGVFNANGAPDTSFGSNGFSLTPQAGNTAIEDALLQPDGKIVVGGTKISAFDGRWRFHIARFNANGTFDLTFGNGGKVSLPVGYDSSGLAVAIQPDNKLLLAGFGTYPSRRKQQIAVNRFQGGNGPIPTSAMITGQVSDDFSLRGVGGVQVVLTSSALSAPLTTRTNPFGFYRFPNLPVNVQYNLSIETKKRATFKTSLSNILLNGDEYVEDMVFRYSGSNTPILQ